MDKIYRNENPVSGWQEAEKIIPDEKMKLGIHFTEQGTVIFRLWSPAAFSVKIKFYKNSGDTAPMFTKDCEYNPENGVWTYEHVDCTVIEGCFYDYLVKTANGEKVCLDP